MSSLDSSIQNLSDVTQPLTAKPTEFDLNKEPNNKNNSDSSDDTHKNLGECIFFLIFNNYFKRLNCKYLLVDIKQYK